MRPVLATFFYFFAPLVLLFGAPALGFFEHNYGLGAIATGRVGSVTAEPENAYAAIYNPALLASTSTSLFAFTVGTAAARLEPFEEVRTDSSEFRTVNGMYRSGSTELHTEPSTVWTAGVSHPFYLPFARGYRAGWGLALSGPFQRARQFRAGTPYDFEQLRYGAADSQFKGSLGAAVEIVPGALSFGAGASIYLTGAGSADATVVATNPTARLLIDVAFNAALLAGIHAHRGPWNLGFAFRDPIDPQFRQQFTGRVELGGNEVVQQPMLLQTSMYWEPSALDLDLSHRGDRFTWTVGASFQRWAGFQPSYLVVETVDTEGKVRGPDLPKLSMRDTLNPRASLGYRASEPLDLSIGYQYRPTPVRDLSGPGNLVDSDVHVFGISASYRFALPAVWPEPLRVAAFGQYHRISRRAVSKARPDFIGSPGYTIGGNAYCGGLEFQVEL